MNKKILIIVGALIIVVVGVILFFIMQGGQEEPEVVINYSEYSPGEFFVTNVKDSKRLLKVAIVLVVNADELQETLKAENSLIRDKIIFILRTLTEEDILSNETVPRLRQQILAELNASFETSGIVEVRFNDFVMQ